MQRPQLHGGAGASTSRWHRDLHRRWRKRYFGRWLYLPGAMIAALLLAAPFVHGYWLFADGCGAGGLFVMIGALGELAPDHIQRKQRGALGEQWTAQELRRLKRRGWLVRHDVAATYGNHDHIVLGDKLYLLNTKNFSDSRLEIEGAQTRVVRLDDEDVWYDCSRIATRVAGEARGISAALRTALGVRVWVNAVVVVWGSFQGPTTVGATTFVHGRDLREWLSESPGNPTRPLAPATRDSVERWLRGLPRAEPVVTATNRTAQVSSP